MTENQRKPQGTSIAFLQNVRQSVCEIVRYKGFIPESGVTQQIYGKHLGTGWKMDVPKKRGINLNVIITCRHVVESFLSNDKHLYACFKFSNAKQENNFLYVSLCRGKNEKNLKGKTLPQRYGELEADLDYHLFFLNGREDSKGSDDDITHIDDIPGLPVNENYHFHPSLQLLVVHIPELGHDTIVSCIPYPTAKIRGQTNNENTCVALDYESFGTIPGSSGGPLIHNNYVYGIHRAANCGIDIKKIIEHLVQQNSDNVEPMLRFTGYPEFMFQEGRDKNSQGAAIKPPQRPNEKQRENELETEVAFVNKCMEEISGGTFSRIIPELPNLLEEVKSTNKSMKETLSKLDDTVAKGKESSQNETSNSSIPKIPSIEELSSAAICAILDIVKNGIRVSFSNLIFMGVILWFVAKRK